MKKSDKKLENELRKALTKVCDRMLYDIEGFIWLTHLVDFNSYPKSLRIVCVFRQDEELKRALETKQDELFCCLIQDELVRANISIKNSHQYVFFDTQEACERSDEGNWNRRFNRLELH